MKGKKVSKGMKWRVVKMEDLHCKCAAPTTYLQCSWWLGKQKLIN